jgi:hypothetical protein
MHRYRLTIKHDKGTVHIDTHAINEAKAREIIMAAELCPSRAIRRVRAVDEHGFEMQPSNPSQRRVIAPPAANVRITDFPGYRLSAAKTPTRYEVLLDGRWRRVFTTRDTGLRYCVHDNLNVVVDLPGDLT